jgi:uncharacterized membrane protein
MDHPSGPSRAAKRARFAMPGPRQPRRLGRTTLGLILAAAVLVVGSVLVLFAAPALGLGGPRASAATRGHAPYPLLQAQDGAVRIPLASLQDGKAHFYAWLQDGQTIELFAVRASDGSIRTAFNACEICYPYKRGYRQQGTEMICNECDMHFPFEGIGTLSGGCDPVPLASSVVGDSVVIQGSELANGAHLF